MRNKLRVTALLLTLVCLLSACNFTANLYDNTGNKEMEAAPQIEEMLAALAAGDRDAALALYHPKYRENFEAALDQLSGYVAGRTMSSMESASWNTTTSKGTGGTSTQESGSFRVTMEDGEVFYISAVHLTDGNGEGFVSFQIVLGVA